MSSIEEMPKAIQAKYRNPGNEVAIWEAAALLLDIPPTEFQEWKEYGEAGVSYQPTDDQVSISEQQLIHRQHELMVKSLMNMARNRGYETEHGMFTQVLLRDVMQWCATHEGLHPKIWEGINLHDPGSSTESAGSQSEQAAQLTVEQLYPFLDKAHPRYSGELAAAVYAWLAFEQVEVGSATKKSLEWWLDANEEALKIDGSGAIERIAAVANWNKKGGKAKNGSGVKLKEVPELEAVTEQLAERLRQLTHQIQHQRDTVGEFVSSPYISVSKLEPMLEQTIESALIRLMERKSRLRPEVQERIAQLAEDLKKARDAHMASKSDESDFSDVPF